VEERERERVLFLQMHALRKEHMNRQEDRQKEGEVHKVEMTGLIRH
jgi:hypothetical protein